MARVTQFMRGSVMLSEIALQRVCHVWNGVITRMNRFITHVSVICSFDQRAYI